jgi:formate hydrogenlyase transcriptional activator
MTGSADLGKAAWDAATVAILIVSPDGAIRQVNDALQQQLGYSRDALIGKPLETLVPHPLQDLLDQHRAPHQRAPGVLPVGQGLDLTAIRADGSLIPIEIGLTPFDSEFGSMLLVSIIDISEHRQAAAAHQASLERQYEFERLIASLSIGFIDAPDAELGDAIAPGLEAICARLDLDRAAYYPLVEGHLEDAPVAWAAEGQDARDVVFADRDGYPWVTSRLLEGETVSFEWVEELPDSLDRERFRAAGTRSALLLPISIEGRVAGVVEFDTVREHRAWSSSDTRWLELFAGVLRQVLSRQLRDAAIRAASEEAGRLKHQLQIENRQLLGTARALVGEPRVVGHSAALRRVLTQIDQVANTDATVLLLGETGTGKELFASYIHELSARHARPMVRVNCAAIPATLMESELFGRERGAFTGSLSRQIGRFELAHRSTIFLDEIGDLTPEVQIKLLRVLEERTIERLGSPHSIEIDVRIIAATHRNLEALMAEQLFRDDLFYRLNVFPIYVPPLRERAEDIPLLLSRFVEEFSKTFGKRVDEIDKASITALQQYSWPGNIRELRNVVERAMIVTSGRRLTIPSPKASAAALKRSPRLVDVEKEHIRAVLDGCGWRIRGADGAASALGLKPTTLETRMAKLGLKRPGKG